MISTPASEYGVQQWRRIAIGGGAAMFIGIAMGRFSYTTMVPPLIQSGQLSELEAGYVGGLNLAAFFFGAFFAERLRNAFPIRAVLSTSVWIGLLALAASALPWGFIWLAIWRAFERMNQSQKCLLGQYDRADHQHQSHAINLLW